MQLIRSIAGFAALIAALASAAAQTVTSPNGTIAVNRNLDPDRNRATKRAT